MSKRSRKKLQQSKVNSSSLSATRLETMRQRAENDLLEGNPRRAREGFRRLMKEDPERFSAPYWLATEQEIMRALSAKQIPRAEELLNAARKALGDEFTERIEALALRLLAGSDSGTKLAEKAWARMGPSWEKGELSTDEGRFLADCLVLGEGDMKEIPEALTSEAEAVRRAMAAVAEEDMSGAEDALRPLGRRSVFSDWKLFFKGFAAMAEGEYEKAKRFFETTDPNFVPGRAARLCEKVINGDISLSQSEIRSLCFLAGEPQAAEILPEVNSLWTAKQWGKALRKLQVTRKDVFPAMDASLWRDLTSLFYHTSHLNTNETHGYVDDFVDRFMSGRFGHVEGCVTYRFVVETWSAWDPLGFLRRAAEGLIKSHKGVYGEDPLVEARICCHIAKAFLRSKTEEAIDTATQYVNRAIEQDPTYLKAYLLHEEILKEHGSANELNALYKVITDRFPDSTEVLKVAGINDIKRGVYKRGIERLEKALATDSYNRSIHRWIIHALSRNAWKLYKNGNFDKARACFQQMTPYQTDDLMDPFAGKFYLQDLQQLFEEHFIGAGNRDVAKAIEAAIPKQTQQLIRVLRGGLFGTQDPGWSNMIYRIARKVLATKKKKLEELAIGRRFERQAEDMVELSRQGSESDKFLFHYLYQIVESKHKPTLDEFRMFAKEIDFQEMNLLVSQLIADLAHLHPDDPFIQMCRLGCVRQVRTGSTRHWQPGGSLLIIDEAHLQEFFAWREKARATGDSEALELANVWEKLIRKHMEILEQRRRRENSLLEDEDDDDEDEYYYDDEEDDDDDDEEDEDELYGAEFLAQLSELSDRDLKKLGKKMGMTEEVFNDMMEAVRLFRQLKASGAADLPPDPRGRSKKGPGDQLDLF